MKEASYIYTLTFSKLHVEDKLQIISQYTASYIVTSCDLFTVNTV